MPDKDGRNQRPIIGVEREKSHLQALRSKIVQTNASHWIVNHECRLSLGSGKSWVELRPATESTMSLHIRQTPPPRLSVRAAMMWVSLIALVMYLAILLADHMPPPV
jgi:hypothetical protein